MRNQEQLKIIAIKTLAIIGFLATILLLLWAMVQTVRFLPGAFSSLATIAESLREYDSDPELRIMPEKSIVNNGEKFRISWGTTGDEGVYHFSYACTQGVSVDIEDLGDELLQMNCNDELSLPETVDGITVIISSERQRFIDVPFTVTFENADGEMVLEESTEVTVVNATIPQDSDLFAQLEETENSASVTESTEEEPEEETPPAEDTEADPRPNSPRAPAPTQTFVSYIPESQPNGFTDLQIRYLGIGDLQGDAFVPQGTFEDDERGAIKFEVKNIGTKTSGDWTFSAILPSSIIYYSDEQAPLKPNERVVFTLGFTVSDSPDVATIAAQVFGGNDTNAGNNSFDWTVRID